jgi:hypothetical protein
MRLDHDPSIVLKNGRAVAAEAKKRKGASSFLNDDGVSSAPVFSLFWGDQKGLRPGSAYFNKAGLETVA